MKLFAWALLLLPLAANAGEKREVLVLSSSQRAREAVLVDALRIYTRDLGRTVRLGGSAPTSLAPEELSHIAESTEGAEIAVWFGERAGLPVLFALRIDTLDVRDTPVELDDPQQAARALALKVRALLTQRTESWTVTAPSPSPSPLPPPIELLASPSPAPRTLIAPSPSPTAAPSRRTWVEISALYEVIVPSNPDWVRHGLLLKVAIPWRFLSFFADTAFMTAPTVTLDGHPITARFWPVALGVELRLRRPKWQIAGGPRLSLLVIEASAVGDNGRFGSGQRFTGGVGLVGDATWLFSKYVGALIQIGAEVLTNPVDFGAGGSGRSLIGWVQVQFAAGLQFSIP
jgi:hypothetical protein